MVTPVVPAPAEGRHLTGRAGRPRAHLHVLAYDLAGLQYPYLLRRGHGLPLYGIAEWQATQPAPDDDDLDSELCAFSSRGALLYSGRNRRLRQPTSMRPAIVLAETGYIVTSSFHFLKNKQNP